MDETNSATKYASDHDSTSALKVLEPRGKLEEMIEGESPTVRHRYQPKAARVSLVRRLLNWFMNRFGAV